MSEIRRIPITVAPLPGEAIDSWLGALAHKTHTCWADLIEAVGLADHATAKDSPSLPRWLLNPTDEQFQTLHAATGISAARLKAMSLAAYDGRALAIDDSGAGLGRDFPWRPRRGSRYCPQCLAETDGRWSLSWRLSWTFACVRHRCLLVHHCPACGDRARVRQVSPGSVPKPGRCLRTRCATDLTTAPVIAFDHDEHPALHAQRWINAVLAGQRPPTGLYREREESGRDILAMARYIAVLVLKRVSAEELVSQIPPDVLDAHRRDHAPLEPTGRIDNVGLAQRRSPRNASATAVGVIAALNCLDQPDYRSAGEALHWLTATLRGRYSRAAALATMWKTALPRAIQIVALTPDMTPHAQLRYRAASPLVFKPHCGRLSSVKVPTMLWSNHTLRLAVRGCGQRNLQAALTALLLVVGADSGGGVRFLALRGPINLQGVSRVLRMLHEHQRWTDISAALVALVDDIEAGDTVIDYDRRRLQDYRDLLPDREWLRICRETDTASGGVARAAVARYYLYERVSGQSVDDVSAETRTKIADFPYYLTPELAEALDTQAHEFLAARGIHDEPVHYEHPTTCWAGLQLPGEDPDLVDLAALHHHVRSGLSLGQAAVAAGTSLDAARYLLSRSPAPVFAGAEPGAYYRAKHSYPRQKLIEQYHARGRSLADLADAAGVSKQTLTRLAADYGLTLREPGRRTQHTVDRAWLHREYVTNGRTIDDLAAEKGVSATTIARWAKNHDIPLRPRGGAQNTAGTAHETQTA